MPRDFIKAGLSIVARSGKAIIGSVDDDGFPNLKAMLKPRENDGFESFLFHDQYSLDAGQTIPEKSKGFNLFLRHPVFQGPDAEGHDGGAAGPAHQRPHLA